MFLISMRVVLACLVLFLASCASTPMTEQQRYEKLQNGIKYNTYRKLSKSGLGATVEVYNAVQERQGKQPASKEYIHALAGFSWAMIMSADFSIAESNMAIRPDSQAKSKYIALSTLSIALYQKGWNGLAKDYANQANFLLNSGELSGDYSDEQRITHLVLGSVAIYKGDSVIAQNSFTKLGEDLDKPWLADLARTAALFTSGAFSESYRLISGILDNQKLSVREREHLTQFKHSIGLKDQQNNNSGVNIGHSISSFVYDLVLENSDEDTQEIFRSFEKFQSTINI